MYVFVSQMMHSTHSSVVRVVFICSAFASKHSRDFPQRGVARQTGNNPAQPRIADLFANLNSTDTVSKWVAKQQYGSSCYITVKICEGRILTQCWTPEIPATHWRSVGLVSSLSINMSNSDFSTRSVCGCSSATLEGGPWSAIVYTHTKWMIPFGLGPATTYDYTV